MSGEPHVRLTDGTLFKPDIIATEDQDVVVSDVQVVWEGAIHPAQQHLNKRRKYQDDAKFQKTIDKMFPGKNIIYEPFTSGHVVRSRDAISSRKNFSGQTTKTFQV